jgi:hypothetical protein
MTPEGRKGMKKERGLPMSSRRIEEGSSKRRIPKEAAPIDSEIALPDVKRQQNRVGLRTKQWTRLLGRPKWTALPDFERERKCVCPQVNAAYLLDRCESEFRRLAVKKE